jgi:hypothetical protein
MNAIEYIKHLYALRYTTYIRRDGKGYYLVDGVEIPEGEFKAMHKLPTVLNRSMDNPDRTRLWLG